MPLFRWGLWAFLMLALVGCSTWFRDRASDYRNVKELPPLVLPDGQETRPIRPLYPIPEGEIGSWDVNKKKMKAPAPKPLVLTGNEPDIKAPESGKTTRKPVLTQDGNGYPVVSVDGEFYAVWDRVGEALKAANITIDDRDQSTGLYFLKLADSHGKPTLYQLRVSRGQSACILMLQQDDDTLAPQGTTKALFESIVRHWPPEPGEINGKA